MSLHQRIALDHNLGNECNDESYDRMPVSDFGLVMLKSMGWSEGKGIGKNPQNALIKPIEYIPNHDRAGLGARKDVPSLKKKRIHEGGNDENIQTKHVVEIGAEKTHKKKGLSLHSRVLVTEGKYENLSGIIVHIDHEAKESLIELEINQKKVYVATKYLRLQENNVQNQENTDLYSKDDENKGKKDSSEKKKLKWVQPNIKVRIISKKFRDGKFYEAKVNITDILDKYSFLATDESRNIIEGLREKDIETYLPKINEYVKVLFGEHTGEIGQLIYRNKQENKIQVKLVDSQEIKEYTQDDCSALAQRI